MLSRVPQNRIMKVEAMTIFYRNSSFRPQQITMKSFLSMKKKPNLSMYKESKPAHKKLLPNLIHLSLLWISVAQYQMSNSWRIGIDENNKTELITKGLFSYSRNPIFLGMIISVAGIFFILPNALTFFLILSTYIVIQIQIRLEEEFLEKQHGQEYLSYKQTTKRLL